MKTFNKILFAVLAVGSFTAGMIFGHQTYSSLTQAPEQTFSGVNSVAGIPYYLFGGGAGITDTSITLTSFKQPVSRYPLSMADFGDIGYLTIEPGNTTRQEFISFTGVVQNSDGSATLTGVTRGLSPVSPYTASTTLRVAHAGGVPAVVSNPPQFYERFGNKLNTQYITGAWGFQVTAPTSTVCTSGSQLCNKDYVDSTANAGAATSTETNGGIVELATAAEAAASFDGGVFKPTVLQSKYAAATPSANVLVPVTSALGKLAQGFFDLTQHFIYTSLFATAASSTNATTTTSHYFPFLTSTLLKTDSAGKLSAAVAGTDYSRQPYVYASTTAVTTGSVSCSNSCSNFSYATSAPTLTIPAGTLTASSSIEVKVFGNLDMGSATGGASGSCSVSLRTTTGTSIFTGTIGSGGSSDDTEGQLVATVVANNSVVSQTSIYVSANEDVGSGGSGTSAIDFSQAQTLRMVAVANASSGGGEGVDVNSCALTGYSIVVHP